MPDPVTGITAATSVYGASQARKSSKSATAAAGKAEQAELDFAKQQYSDWQAIYGPIQKNLGAYYDNLTPTRIEAQGRQAIELERSDYISRIEENFQQRGLGDSALEASTLADVERTVGQQKAQLAVEAPIKAAQEKLNFLTIGYGNNPANMTQQVLSNVSSRKADQAYKSEVAAGQALQSAVGTVGTALGDYFGGKK